ncbi:MAG: hypothetical protein ACOYLG_05590 [Chitinophagaceae bacterium]
MQKTAGNVISASKNNVPTTLKADFGTIIGNYTLPACGIALKDCKVDEKTKLQHSISG